MDTSVNADDADVHGDVRDEADVIEPADDDADVSNEAPVGGLPVSNDDVINDGAGAVVEARAEFWGALIGTVAGFSKGIWKGYCVGMSASSAPNDGAPYSPNDGVPYSCFTSMVSGFIGWETLSKRSFVFFRPASDDVERDGGIS